MFWCDYAVVRFWAIWLVCFSVTFVVFGIFDEFWRLVLVVGDLWYFGLLVVFGVVWVGWVGVFGVLVFWFVGC